VQILKKYFSQILRGRLNITDGVFKVTKNNSNFRFLCRTEFKIACIVGNRI